MKIVLLEDVKSIGKKGDLATVSDGYARNFLMPRKLAKEANSQVMNEFKNAEAAKAHKKKVETEVATENADKLKDKSIKIYAKGNGGKLFGSVTAKEIAVEVQKQHGIAIDKRKVHLDADIKGFGTFEFKVKLHTGVLASMSVIVCEET